MADPLRKRDRETDACRGRQNARAIRIHDNLAGVRGIEYRLGVHHERVGGNEGNFALRHPGASCIKRDEAKRPGECVPSVAEHRELFLDMGERRLGAEQHGRTLAGFCPGDAHAIAGGCVLYRWRVHRYSRQRTSYSRTASSKPLSANSPRSANRKFLPESSPTHGVRHQDLAAPAFAADPRRRGSP